MRYIFLILTTFICFSSYSQNWSLFPLNQESFFSDNSHVGNILIDSYKMDSVKINGSDTILYFRKNLNLQGAGTCYINLLQNIPWGQDNLYYINSLIQRSDTIFFLSNFSSKPFYFLPHATVGQSWTVISTYSLNDYNQITITCTSLTLQTFLGITDSVKTFSMSANGTSVNQTPVDSFEMRLSKSHGLIEFVPFNLFLYHPSNVFFNSLKLIGIDSVGILYGYRQPNFSDYFHLSIGDLLLWEHSYDPANIMYPTWIEYFKDSITNALITPDSVIYTYDRTKLDTASIITHEYNLIDKFLFSEFGNIVGTTPNWIGFGNNRFSGAYPWFSNKVFYWQSTSLLLKIDSITNDSITTFSFATEASTIDTTNCQTNTPFDVKFDFTVDTRTGVTQHCYYNFDWDCYTLIGSLVNGKQKGDITLSTIELHSTKILSLNIIPNPASENIFIHDILPSKNSRYEIFNSIGQKVKVGNLEENSISIHELSNGPYILKIQTERGYILGKFIKS